MTSYEEEFLSTGQEARRLSIALLRFIQIDDPEWKNKYQKYLSLRFRPALSTLIREGDLTRIRALCSFAPVTESALNSFIDVAVQKTALVFMTVNLLFKLFSGGFYESYSIRRILSSLPENLESGTGTAFCKISFFSKINMGFFLSGIL